MDSLWTWIKSEPVAIQSVVQTSLGLILAFGVHVTPIQIGAILAVTGSMLALITRQVVTPVSKLTPKDDS